MCNYFGLYWAIRDSVLEVSVQWKSIIWKFGQSEMIGFPYIILHTFFFSFSCCIIQAHVQNFPLITYISRTITVDMQRRRTGPFLPTGAAVQKTVMMWEIPEAYGEMRHTSSSSDTILQNYLKYILKFPTHHSEKWREICETKGSNSVISMIVQTQLHQGPDKSTKHWKP